MIDLIDLCQQPDIAASTGGNFGGGAGKGSEDGGAAAITPSCRGRKRGWRCWSSRRRGRTGPQTDRREQADISHDRVYSKPTARRPTV